eukprot:356176-Chlamydomonas_euryale.AAC.2
MSARHGPAPLQLRCAAPPVSARARGASGRGRPLACPRRRAWTVSPRSRPSACQAPPPPPAGGPRSARQTAWGRWGGSLVGGRGGGQPRPPPPAGGPCSARQTAWGVPRRALVRVMDCLASVCGGDAGCVPGGFLPCLAGVRSWCSCGQLLRGAHLHSRRKNDRSASQ